MSIRQLNIQGDLTASKLIHEAAEESLGIELVTTAKTDIETPFGVGQVFSQDLQPGLRCEIHAMNCHSDLEFECNSGPQVSCSITVEGRLDSPAIEGIDAFDTPLNQARIIGLSEPMRWIQHVYADQFFKTFCVTLQPIFFERFANSFEDEQISVLEPFLVSNCAQVLPLSQALIYLGNKAFDHSYNGSLISLYQESNALQFILELIKNLREENCLVQKIGRKHYDRLLHARAILDDTLLSPPKTLDLARQVGTNINTLQAHFKLAFGTTIFSYVKSQRLEMARVLLQEHRLGAAETGYRVGFSSPSAFTASYRKYFGHPPSVTLNLN